MARFSSTGGGSGSGAPGPQGPAGNDGTNGSDGLDSLFLGTWDSVTEFLAVYQGGPVGLADGDWWAFVKDNANSNKIYVVREDPTSATGWVIDDNEHFDLPAGPKGDPGTPGADGSDGTDALWNYTGEYSGGSSYAVGDVVTYDGQLWYRFNANGGNVGDTPSPGLWNLLAAKGTDGTNGSGGLVYLGNYILGNGYIADLAVVRGSDNNLYIAKSSGGLSDPVGNTAEWDIFSDNTAGGTVGDITKYYGSFYNTETVSLTSATTAYSIPLNTTVEALGVSIASNSRITVANAGVYNIQFSLQLDKTDSGSDVVNVWLSKNNSNVAWSNTQFTVTGSSGKYVAALNLFVTLAINDYVELKAQSPDTHMRIVASGTQANPDRPAVPSSIVTINQIS